MTEKRNDIRERFVFRDVRPEEAEEVIEIEQICFPPNEACSPGQMRERVKAAPGLFLVAEDRKTGRIAGFLNGLSTKEERFRDEFFQDASLYDPEGKTVMLLGLDVRPEYRRQGLATAIMEEYCRRETLNGRTRLVLTCLDDKVDLYKKMGYLDLGESDSVWGGEKWHEMDILLFPGREASPGPENAFLARLRELRRYFHRHPELSWQEPGTQKKIIQVLEELGIPYVKACRTGVIATIKGKKSTDRVIGIRADIDALPVEELSGCAYSSENPGVSHACGHDCHITILLGTAMKLAAMKDELTVTVRLIFQPSEEYIQDSGAVYMAREELVRSCDRLIGLHIWSKIAYGYASLRYGAVTAATDTFDIAISGKGGHGGMPHQAVDPLAAGVELVSSINRVVSREIPPLEPHVISVTSFQAGTASNIIPDKAHLKGTVRCFSREVRAAIPPALERLAAGIGEATRTDIQVDYHFGPPPTINDDPAVETSLRAAKKVFGEERILPFEPQMIGEDFAEYTNEKCFMLLGGGFAEEDRRYPQHSPYFTIDERALLLGVAYFVEYVKEYM